MFKTGDKVKFKKSSLDSGMIDATEDDVFKVVSVQESHWGTLVKLEGIISTVNITHLEHVKEEIMEEQEIKWEVGQEVFCLLRGKGVVHQIYNTGMDWSEGVDVCFMNHGIIRFKFDGTIGTGFNRSLFFSEPKIEAEKFPPKKPFVPTLKKGDSVIGKNKVYKIELQLLEVEYENKDHVKTTEGHIFKKEYWNFYRMGEEIIFN